MAAGWTGYSDEAPCDPGNSPPAPRRAAERAGASWPREEDLQLREETGQSLPLKAIAHIHGRTTGAIRSRQIRLGLRDRETGRLIEPIPDDAPPVLDSHTPDPAPTPADAPASRSGRRWTPEEDRRLYEATTEGAEPEAIALILNRGAWAVRVRQRRLGMRLRSAHSPHQSSPNRFPHGMAIPFRRAATICMTIPWQFSRPP